jgi:hypothetical protein
MNFSILAAVIAATIGKYSDVVTRALVAHDVNSEVPAIRSFFYTGGQYVDDGEGGHVFRGQMYIEKLVPAKGPIKETPIVMIHGVAQTGTVS